MPTTSRRPLPDHAHRPGRRTGRARGRSLTIAAVGALAIVGFAIGASRLGSADPAGTTATPPPASSTASASTSAAPAAQARPSTAPAAPPSAAIAPAAQAAPFSGGFLVADRGNGRILAIDAQGTIHWSFPAAGALPRGQAFAADDAFLSPDRQTVVANDEAHQVIDRIDIATGRIVWQYGHYGRAGSAPGYLHTPDDAYPLANGDVVVADIRNCRVLEIAPDKSIVRQWGRTGRCGVDAPVTYGQPNGDTPLPDGGLLVTEIVGSRVVRLAPDGHVVFDIHVPVAYPSDAQLDANGNVVVADFSSPGQVVAVSPTGRLVWRYRPTSGPGRMDHPSLATPLPGGLVSINDDGRDRVIVVDPVRGVIVWQYGTTGRSGSGPGLLSDPDGHQALPPGVFGL